MISPYDDDNLGSYEHKLHSYDPKLSDIREPEAFVFYPKVIALSFSSSRHVFQVEYFFLPGEIPRSFMRFFFLVYKQNTISALPEALAESSSP